MASSSDFFPALFNEYIFAHTSEYPFNLNRSSSVERQRRLRQPGLASLRPKVRDHDAQHEEWPIIGKGPGSFDTLPAFKWPPSDYDKDSYDETASNDNDLDWASMQDVYV
jgi:hypothetical protein